MREVFETMIDIAKKDPRVVVIVADISHGLFKNLGKFFLKDILILVYASLQ